MVATSRVAAIAQIIRSYSPGVANVRLYLVHGFLPLASFLSNGILISSSVYAELSGMADRQTRRPRYVTTSIAIARV